MISEDILIKENRSKLYSTVQINISQLNSKLCQQHVRPQNTVEWKQLQKQGKNNKYHSDTIIKTEPDHSNITLRWIRGK